jgi:hypothetical protein
VPSVEERLATLEGRIQEQAAFMADVRGSTAEAIRELRRDFDQTFQLIDQRFQLVDRRFEQVNQRFEQVDQRFERVEQRFDHIDRRFDRVERLLMWMFGATLTGFTAVMAAAIGSVLRLR